MVAFGSTQHRCVLWYAPAQVCAGACMLAPIS